MGVNGYHLFVRSDDANAVEKAIRAYVDEHGAGAKVDAEDDGRPPSADRKQRAFAISPSVDGTIAIWEDGSWADRGLARDLSRRLGAEAIWLMISDVTDSWAYARYVDGDDAGSEHREPDDVHGEAQRFVRDERLPFAFEFLEDPNEDAEYAAFEKELAATGFFDEKVDDDSLSSAWDDAEREVGVVELDDDDEEEDDGEDEEDGISALDAVRGELREFAVDI